MMMNKLWAIYCSLVLQIWLLCHSPALVSQVSYDQAYQAEALDRREQVVVFTDRVMYAVNERIRFRSFYRMDDSTPEELWSRVLYIELVTPDGTPVARGKYPLSSAGAAGYLAVPGDALTGTYYLRAYTRWMRNFGPQSFCYVPLKIINPYDREVTDGANSTAPAEILSANTGYRGILCRSGKPVYAPGEQVRLELSFPGNGAAPARDYCLTVAPAGLLDTACAWINPDIQENDRKFSFDYLPDIRGISLSGSVINTADGSPVPSAQVHFSLLHGQPGYLITLSDESGRFILTLPDRTGNQELFVACEASERKQWEILIDQDFESGPPPFGTKPFELSPEEKQAATHMAVNMQLDMAYRPAETYPDTANPGDSEIQFYGTPEVTVITDVYVQLPTMREVFENLVPNVYVLSRRGEPYFKFESMNRNIHLLPPLLLIDRLPVFDQQAFLSVDPSKIKRIEVINEVYVKGSTSFGGIIHLISHKGDMAAVDLPEGSYFFDYQAYHPGDLKGPGNPEGSGIIPATATPGDSRIPDTRNTLLWIDSLRLDTGEKKTFQFRAAPGTGEYRILVRGVSPHGEIICGVGTFMVE